jgi:hypothetical protein
MVKVKNKNKISYPDQIKILSQVRLRINLLLKESGNESALKQLLKKNKNIRVET